MLTANPLVMVTNASSTFTVPSHPGTVPAPANVTAGAPLHAPYEQLMKLDGQTLLIAPQLLKSMSRLTHEPDGCRTVPLGQGADAREKR